MAERLNIADKTEVSKENLRFIENRPYTTEFLITKIDGRTELFAVTAKELEVLTILTKNPHLRSSEIAERMGVESDTISKYLSGFYLMFDIPNSKSSIKRRLLLMDKLREIRGLIDD